MASSLSAPPAPAAAIDYSSSDGKPMAERRFASLHRQSASSRSLQAAASIPDTFANRNACVGPYGLVKIFQPPSVPWPTATKRPPPHVTPLREPAKARALETAVQVAPSVLCRIMAPGGDSSPVLVSMIPLPVPTATKRPPPHVTPLRSEAWSKASAPEAAVQVIPSVLCTIVARLEASDWPTATKRPPPHVTPLR